MTFVLQHPYEARPIAFLGLWEAAGYRLKVYGISHGRARPRDELVEAAKQVASEFLDANHTQQRTHNVGFLGVHDGRGENQVFLDRWINENELMHDYWVSPVDRPAELVRPGSDHNSVCVWDLAVQGFERTAWLKHVLTNPAGPGVAGYLRDVMNASV